MKKKILILIIIGFVIGAAAVFALKMNNAPKYNVQKAQKRTITQIVEASGTINPVNTVSVGSTVSGLMAEIYVDFNSVVKKGQLIARMDRVLLQTDVDRASGNLKKQQAIVENNKKTYERYKNLYERNFMSRSELDSAETSYRTSLSELDAAQAQYKNAATLLSFADIVSPVDGIVISREVEVGQPVAASFQAPKLFVIAEDLKKMKIEVNISEADIGKIKEGQEVEYTLDGTPDKTYHGTVAQVRLNPTTVSNVVTYTVIIYVDNDDLELKPGMTANVSIITMRRTDAVCVPNMALKFTPLIQNPGQGSVKKYDRQGVWIMKKGKPERVEIELGASSDAFTEVISDEIQEGTPVIVGLAEDKKGKKPSGSGAPGMRMF